MSIPNKQIGWSQESNLLWYILKQLNKLTSIIFNLKPKYKVYTALLTQSGGSDAIPLQSGNLIVGVTYLIYDNSPGMDFTNVGAPNNNVGTSFVATGTTPNSWGTLEGLTDIIEYNTGAPVVTVLENTIGNIWFTYHSVGQYYIHTSQVWDNTKTWYEIGGVGNSGGFDVSPGNTKMTLEAGILNILTLGNDNIDTFNNQLNNTPIEIRVYN